MFEIGDTAKADDIIILYGGIENIMHLKLEEKKILQCRRGIFPHDNIIGKQFGEKIVSTKGDGYMHLLPMTCELWSHTVKHRTQILYLSDISIILFYLEVKAGSRVIESGTGSGSLSTSFARAIAPHGHLYTYEFHNERADLARQEFENHKISHLITVTTRDVVEQGFEIEGLEEQTIDAVFLDLPKPWLVLDKADKFLKPNGIFCGFSPCIEQVQKTCEGLTERNFVDIQTFECLIRPYDVTSNTAPIIEFGENTTKWWNMNKKKENTNNDKKTDENLPIQENEKMEIINEKNDQNENSDKDMSENDKTNENKDNMKNEDKFLNQGLIKRGKKDADYQHTEFLTVKPQAHIKGHTGYLTFAKKLVPILDIEK